MCRVSAEELGLRLWGQGELSRGQPAVLVAITNSEQRWVGGGGTRSPDGELRPRAWRPRVKGDRVSSGYDRRPYFLLMAMVTASTRTLPTRLPAQNTPPE